MIHQQLINLTTQIINQPSQKQNLIINCTKPQLTKEINDQDPKPVTMQNSQINSSRNHKNSYLNAKIGAQQIVDHPRSDLHTSNPPKDPFLMISQLVFL